MDRRGARRDFQAMHAGKRRAPAIRGAFDCGGSRCKGKPLQEGLITWLLSKYLIFSHLGNAQQPCCGRGWAPFACHSVAMSRRRARHRGLTMRPLTCPCARSRLPMWGAALRRRQQWPVARRIVSMRISEAPALIKRWRVVHNTARRSAKIARLAIDGGNAAHSAGQSAKIA